MTPQNFLDLPMMSNPEAIAFLLDHGLDFAHWPQGLLPPAASSHLREVAQATFDERDSEVPAGMEDHLVLDEYLNSCASEKAILRTPWGYLTGDSSPRWVDGVLVLMHTIGIASPRAGKTTVSPGVRSGFAELLKVEAKYYDAVEIWPGNEVELCCIVAQCDCTNSPLVEESRQMQVVELLISMLQKNTMEQLIDRAVSADAGGESIKVENKVTVPESARLH
jgi:hypothetical protein